MNGVAQRRASTSFSLSKIAVGRLGAVGHTADDANGVVQLAVQHVALRQNPEVAIRHEQRGNGTLVEERPRVGLQELQADRRLEAAELELEFRRKGPGEVGIDEGRAAPPNSGTIWKENCMPNVPSAMMRARRRTKELFWMVPSSPKNHR
ncbi:MAG: hypothetical protein WDM96_07015 [Lacunisphaera sp.]